MKKIFKDIRFYFLLVYSLINIVLFVQILLTAMVPMKYKVGIGMALLLLELLMFYLQYGKRMNKVNKMLGKILIVILSATLCLGNVYLHKGVKTIDQIGGDNKDTIQISVVVMDESPYKELKDLENGLFGEISVGETEYNQQAEKEIKEEIDHEIEIISFEGFDVFANALYSDEIDAMILNEGFRGMFEEKHPNFNEETRVIASFTYEDLKEDISKSVSVVEESFLVYITGIDTYGSISTVSRSDVNKIMAINPISRQILLIDIPRDYYIPQVCQGYQNDKLTHTGIFGVDCTVTSVAEFFKEDINYYMRVNFSSLVDIVNALGGINVYSEYNFSAGGYNFTAGHDNYLNGEAALAFSRERYSLPGGDNDRIKNQSRVLTGIIDKATSSSILTNYMSVMNAIGGTFQTNMSDSEISALIHMQLSDKKGWNITSFAVGGTGATDWTPANGFNAYVVYPDMNSVAHAKELIVQLKNGEVPEV